MRDSLLIVRLFPKKIKYLSFVASLSLGNEPTTTTLIRSTWKRRVVHFLSAVKMASFEIESRRFSNEDGLFRLRLRGRKEGRVCNFPLQADHHDKRQSYNDRLDGISLHLNNAFCLLKSNTIFHTPFWRSLFYPKCTSSKKYCNLFFLWVVVVPLATTPLLKWSLEITQIHVRAFFLPSTFIDQICEGLIVSEWEIDRRMTLLSLASAADRMASMASHS